MVKRTHWFARDDYRKTYLRATGYKTATRFYDLQDKEDEMRPSDSELKLHMSCSTNSPVDCELWMCKSERHAAAQIQRLIFRILKVVVESGEVGNRQCSITVDARGIVQIDVNGMATVC
jgi:hypothetical protein